MIDHDASAAVNQHWHRFIASTGLPGVLADLHPDGPRQVYVSPGREDVLEAQLLTSLLPEADLRQSALRSYFAASETRNDPSVQKYLLSPVQRANLIDTFTATSQEFAAGRGYSPDFDAMRAELQAEDWIAPAVLPYGLIERVQHARFQVESESAVQAGMDAVQETGGMRDTSRSDGLITFTLRPRPRLLGLLRWPKI